MLTGVNYQNAKIYQVFGNTDTKMPLQYHMDQLHIMLKVEYNKHTVNVIEVYAKDDMSNKLLATNIYPFSPR